MWRLGSLTPKPMKDREDSVSMQVAKSKVALTIITVMMLGRMWRKMMPNSLTPKALAAVDELLLALGQHAAAHQAGDAGPGEEAQDEHNQDDTLQLGNTVAQNTGQDNTEGKEGDGGDNLGQAHQQVVQLAALVARDAAHNHHR